MAQTPNSKKMRWQELGIDITKVRGEEGKTICPKCSHTRKNTREPCLSIHKTNGTYHCFHCGWKGSANVFPMREKKTYEKPLPRLQKVGNPVADWFASRGISNNTLLRFNITESEEYMPQLDAKSRVICFNYYRNDELVNIKYRGKNKSFRLEKGAELIFYNLDAIADTSRAIIVEGEMDCLSVYEAGIYDVVSVPNGASKGNQRLEYLDNCFEYFENKELIIIATDNDEPGIALRDELARRLGRERCWFVKFPEGCKDSNDVLRTNGKQALVDMFENLWQPPIQGVATLEDYADELERLYTYGFPPGQRAGIRGFDELLTFGEGLLTTVTGAPSSGKDEFVNAITTGLAINYGARIAILSMEETTTVTFSKLIEKAGKKGFHKFVNPEKRLSMEEMHQAAIFVNDHFYILKHEGDDALDLNLDSVLATLKSMVLRYGINYAVISPWNCLEHNIPNGQSETTYINNSLSKITQFAAKTGVHVFMIAHPTKLQKGQDGAYPMPTLYDISGSANWFNKTHNGFAIRRDDNTSRVQVRVHKVKQFWHGKKGDCFFSFDYHSRQYLPEEPETADDTAWKPFY